MRATRILDPRFEYVPSVYTDVAATWRRFGFKKGDPSSRRATPSIVQTHLTRGMWIAGAAAVWAALLAANATVDGSNRS